MAEENFNRCLGKQIGEGMLYSVRGASEIIGISAHTIRYYDKMKLFPAILRNESNARRFTEADLRWMKVIEGLTDSGMSIMEIQHYVALCEQGTDTLEERMNIIVLQEQQLAVRIERMIENRKALQNKISYYRDEIAKLKSSSKDENVDESPFSLQW